MTQGRYVYDYPRPMVTLDAVVFSECAGAAHVLLIRRGNPPFQGMWALPGGFLEMEESLEAAVVRELAEETGVSGVPLTQFQTFGDVGRDPRGRVITIAYVGWVCWGAHAPEAGDDAAHAAWLPVAELPRLACDHNRIVSEGIRHVLTALRADALPAGWLPAGVPVARLRQAVEAAAAALAERRGPEGVG